MGKKLNKLLHMLGLMLTPLENLTTPACLYLPFTLNLK